MRFVSSNEIKCLLVGINNKSIAQQNFSNVTHINNHEKTESELI